MGPKVDFAQIRPLLGAFECVSEQWDLHSGPGSARSALSTGGNDAHEFGPRQQGILTMDLHPTSCGKPSPKAGWPAMAVRTTSCARLVGAVARCSMAAALAQPAG